MEDAEICRLAEDILGNITGDLNETTYRPLGGKLSIAWSDKPIYGAFASSPGQSDKPPQHCITFYYAFVVQVWRDAENICKFLRGIPKESGYDKVYDVWGGRVKLPNCFSKNEHVRNMFTAAITWVYFHELAHLMQEHGIIRAEFGKTEDKAEENTDIHDCEVSQGKRIDGREALVSHVTELAADFEATSFYVTELMRHLMDPDFATEQERPEVFSGLLYLMVCGISLVFFRFHGNKPFLPTAAVEGSHPHPLPRLQFLIPQIFEQLDLEIFRADGGYTLDRRQLVALCLKAAFSATLYWSVSNTDNHGFDTRFMLKGIFSDVATLQYLQPIVRIWDEILPRIKEVRRFGEDAGLMYFTEMARSRISDLITWGKGPEANAPAVAPLPRDAGTS